MNRTLPPVHVRFVRPDERYVDGVVDHGGLLAGFQQHLGIRLGRAFSDQRDRNRDPPVRPRRFGRSAAPCGGSFEKHHNTDEADCRESRKCIHRWARTLTRSTIAPSGGSAPEVLLNFSSVTHRWLGVAPGTLFRGRAWST